MQNGFKANKQLSKVVKFGHTVTDIALESLSLKEYTYTQKHKFSRIYRISDSHVNIYLHVLFVKHLSTFAVLLEH